MNYPIDVEAYILTSRREYGENEELEGKMKFLFNLCNTSYEDGLAGAAGYPLDSDKLLDAVRAETRGVLIAPSVFRRIVDIMNDAYILGQRDAKETARRSH